MRARAWTRRRWQRVRVESGSAESGRTESDRGSTVAEAVIIVPVIIIATLVVVQFVLLWHGRHAAQAAAQTAARAAATYQGSAEGGRADGDAYLAQVAPTLLPGRDIWVTRDATTVVVTIHADVLRVVPFGTFTIDERASAPVEAFTPIAP
jgi:Flp pilus assembly protein TadG